MLVVYGVTPSWAVVLTPFWVLAAMLVVVAVGFPLSALNVRFRDVRLALPLRPPGLALREPGGVLELARRGLRGNTSTR